MAHTPTPYEAKKQNWRGEPSQHDVYISGDFHITKDGGYATTVAIVPGNATSGTIADDTAAFICRACNAHHRLVSAVEATIKHFEDEHDGEHYHLLDSLRSVLVLAKAKG